MHVQWINNLDKIGDFDSNCHGTSLLLVGDKAKDEYFDTYEFELYLKELSQTRYPLIGRIAVWYGHVYRLEREAPVHSGIITWENPLLITHRDGCRGPFLCDRRIEEIDERYGNKRSGLQGIPFYVPKNLS